MTAPATAGNGLFKFLHPKIRSQSIDIQTAAMWGVTIGTGSLWLIQPWDFLRKTFMEKQEEEK